MTALDRLEGRLPELLEDLSLPRVPDYVDEILSLTARARQRPPWISPGRWIPRSPIDTRARALEPELPAGRDRTRLRPANQPRRVHLLTATLRLTAVAVLALVIGIAVGPLLQRTADIGSDPSPSASPTPPAESPSPAPLAWSPASLEQDWPAPVRSEPAGDPVVVPWTGTHTDPRGDAESSDGSRIDILSVRHSPCTSRGVCVDVSASDPGKLVGPGEPWVAYGLVFDTDLDGVADVRLGMERFPAEHSPWGDPSGATDVRAWRTDLQTGTTESGRAGVSVCDCLTATAGGGTAHIYPHEAIPGRFYVWASVIQDGRVVATDYAPDSGWLE